MFYLLFLLTWQRILEDTYIEGGFSLLTWLKDTYDISIFGIARFFKYFSLVYRCMIM